MGAYLGQNFLVDSKIVDNILQNFSNSFIERSLSIIFEIGPGKGAITKYLKSISDNFFVFEKDLNMKKYLLKILDNDQMIFGDILEIDIDNFIKNKLFEIKKIGVIGNLPYYITSPILAKFFIENSFQYGFFMIQKEVGEKIQTKAKKKSYLRWLLNYGYEVNYIQTVPASSFNPIPKVDSCLIELFKKVDLPNFEFKNLIILLNSISMYKRKTLGKIWKIIKQKNISIKDLPVYLTEKRLEDLNWKDIELIV